MEPAGASGHAGDNHSRGSYFLHVLSDCRVHCEDSRTLYGYRPGAYDASLFRQQRHLPNFDYARLASDDFIPQSVDLCGRRLALLYAGRQHQQHWTLQRFRGYLTYDRAPGDPWREDLSSHRDLIQLFYESQ